MSFASTYVAGRFLLLCWLESGYRFCYFCGRKKWPADSHSCIVAENCIIHAITFYIISVVHIGLLKIEKMQNAKIVKTVFLVET